MGYTSSFISFKIPRFEAFLGGIVQVEGNLFGNNS